MVQTDGKMYCVYELEEFTFFKWPYYSKQSTVQYNSYQNAKDVSHRTRTNNIKICMETQKTLNSQNSLEKEQN